MQGPRIGATTQTPARLVAAYTQRAQPRRAKSAAAAARAAFPLTPSFA